MKYYNIAGLTVAMDSFGRTDLQAEPYRLEGFSGEADITVRADWQAFQAAHPHLSRDSSEYLATGGSFYRQLLDFDGMMLHSSAVVLHGRAYLFSAPCGTGKSTHTRLWLEAFGADGAVILNDDKPAVRREEGGFYAYGTPWSGKTDQNCNLRVPLAGICLLRRGQVNRIRPYGGPAALHGILEQTVRSRRPEFMARLLELLDSLMRQVPVWEMECNMDVEAARMSYRAMSAAGKDGNP